MVTVLGDGRKNLNKMPYGDRAYLIKKILGQQFKPKYISHPLQITVLDSKWGYIASVFLPSGNPFKLTGQMSYDMMNLQ